MTESRYEQVLGWLYHLEAARGMDFKLERVALALRHLGEPHTQFRSLHIAGTNGKGSVAAMAEAILSAAGHRTGLYTSPHLIRFTERIRVSGQEIAESEVVSLAEEIQSAATVRGIELTFFEFTTVMAFLHFARQRIDVGVIEVGLGGRLDATNLIEPEVAVITSIGLDHEEYLGDTIEAVTHEKAGIIKAGQDVVIGRLTEAARKVVEDTSAQRGARLWVLDHDFRFDPASRRFTGVGRSIENIELNLDGPFQHDNAAVAIAAVAKLKLPQAVPDAAIQEGCRAAQWPGRLERVRDNPALILDCAHNPHGVETLMRALKAQLGDSRIHLLFAVMRDKRWQQMVHILGPHIASATITSVLPPRGESAERVAAEFRPYVPVRIVDEPIAALTELVKRVPPSETILVTGSLFLIGAVYPYVLQQRGQSQLFNSDSGTHGADT